MIDAADLMRDLMRAETLPGPVAAPIEEALQDILGLRARSDRLGDVAKAPRTQRVLSDGTPDGRQSLQDFIDQRDGNNPEALAWPDGWAAGRDPAEVRACQRLWITVLLSVLRDVLCVTTKDAARNGHYQRTDDSYLRSRDFHTVCALAGVDGTAVADAVDRDPDAMRRRILGQQLFQ